VEIDSLELLVNWRLQRELNERWALGVEGYSEIEDLANASRDIASVPSSFLMPKENLSGMLLAVCCSD
jgi:hypothetical protein